MHHAQSILNVGSNNVELKGYEMTVVVQGYFHLQLRNKVLVWSVILASLFPGAYKVNSSSIDTSQDVDIHLFTVTMYNQQVCALKEVICSILLHLLQTTFVYKLADDVVRNLIRKVLRGHKSED